MQFPRRLPIGAVGGYEGGDGEGAGVGEQRGHVGDAADILFAVRGRETEVGVEAVTDVVAVEAVGGEGVGWGQEGGFEGGGDGGFARGGEAGEPDGEALLAAQEGALGVG